MAEYIKTLKEDNGDITYPVTQAGAVLLSGGGDLETTLNAKASQASVDGKIDIGDVQSTDIVANAVTTAKIANGNVTTAKVANGAITTAKIATSIAWTSGTYASGYKASTNGAYLQGIQACIYNGFLIVRFGVSKTSGNFAANTEVGVGSIPSTINGVDISNLVSGSDGKKNLYRTSVSGSGGAIGFGQFNGLGISVCPTTTASWLAGQFIIPLNW
jgi:hypothetical protein